MKINVTVLTGPGKKDELSFSEFPVSIGRHQDNDLVIKEDTNTSRIHCTIFIDDKDLYIADLKSTNGTVVNGKEIAESVLLSDKDKILVGKTFLQIDISDKN